MAVTILSPDPTVDEVRAALAPPIARNAAFDGWSDMAVEAAATEVGVALEIAGLAFEGGAVAMIDAWFEGIDAAMLAANPPEMLATLRVRDRITRLVETRLHSLGPDRESLRRALAILALPTNLGVAARFAWRAADAMWRAAGDDSADFNYYTKRTLLAGIYSATLLVFIDDESEGQTETRAFLARRIADIGRFENARGRMAARSERRPSIARFVGRLRYHTR